MHPFESSPFFPLIESQKGPQQISLVAAQGPFRMIVGGIKLHSDPSCHLLLPLLSFALRDFHQLGELGGGYRQIRLLRPPTSFSLCALYHISREIRTGDGIRAQRRNVGGKKSYLATKHLSIHRNYNPLFMQGNPAPSFDAYVTLLIFPSVLYPILLFSNQPH